MSVGNYTYDFTSSNTYANKGVQVSIHRVGLLKEA